jgi:hypothetical protein
LPLDISQGETNAGYQTEDADFIRVWLRAVKGIASEYPIGGHERHQKRDYTGDIHDIVNDLPYYSIQILHRFREQFQPLFINPHPALAQQTPKATTGDL